MNNPATQLPATDQPDILLIDNGSRRAASTLSLRRIADALADRTRHRVEPVSLLHADRVPASALRGEPARVLPAHLRSRLATGQRDFITLPLFFGPSRALSKFVPEQADLLRAEFGDLHLQQAQVLCPLPGGEPRLVDILVDNIAACGPADHVVVVDHGSPIPQVTAVRNWLADALRTRLGDRSVVEEAVMERRDGPDYDFNGDLLADKLARLDGRVVLAMLFISPGRHAGEGGDIAEICAAAEQANPGLKVTPSLLIGEHPGLVDILADRLAAVLSAPAAGRAGNG